MAEWKPVRGDTGALFLRGTCLMTYAVREKTWILFDSGSHRDREELFAWLEEQGITVAAVFTSHAHYDHVENHTALKARYGAKLIAPAFDAALVRSSLSLKACFYSCTRPEIERDFGEMLFHADEVIAPGQTRVTWEGRSFRIVELPGHAASHIGYVTPDEVCYLADAVLSPELYGQEQLIYTLDWGRALHTLERIRTLPWNPCVLAHYGITDQAAVLAEENRKAFFRMADRILGCLPERFTLEEAVRDTVAAFAIPVKSVPKARVMERSIRAILEYLTEHEAVRTELENGILCYRQQKQK